jgi:hypothetical protein
MENEYLRPVAANSTSVYPLIKKVTETLPLLSAIVIYYSFVNLFAYYSVFKINIGSFISLSDVLITFLPTTILFLIISTVFVGLIPLIKEIASASVSFQRFTLSIQSVIAKRINLFLIIGLAVLCAWLFRINKVVASPIEATSLVATGVIYCYSIITIAWGRTWLSKNRLFVLVFYLLLIPVLILVYQRTRAKYIQKYGKGLVLEFTFEDKPLRISGTRLYIGQTSSHLFVYSLSDSTTEIYEKDKISYYKIGRSAE